MKSGFEIDRQLFRDAHDHYSKLVDNAKTRYNQSRIEDADSKKIFGIVDDMINNKRENASKFPSNVPTEELPNAFSDFFIENVLKLRNSISSEPLTLTETFHSHVENFLPFSRDDLRSIILETCEKSCILDVLTAKLLQSCIDKLLPFFKLLFEASFRDGVVH